MIDMQPTRDQLQIIDAVSRFLAERLPVSRHRKNHLGGKMEAGLLREIAGLGWIGLGVSENAGGYGYSLLDDVLVCRELGRGLAPMSLFAAVLGARLAEKAGRAGLAARFISGESRAAIAVRSENPAAEESILAVDSLEADWILGLTHDSAYLAPCADFALIEQLPPIDTSIDLERRRVNTPASLVRVSHEGYMEALLLGSAMLVGMAEATRDMAVAYAKTREQFGQAIGAFQSIKHICADTALRAEAAKCQLFFASIELEEKTPSALMHVTAAKITAADACLLNSGANIQVHGGTGFTVECDAHLYVKRAHVLEQILGSQRWHQSLLGSGETFRIEH